LLLERTKIPAQKFSLPAPHQGIDEQPFTSILATSCFTQLLLSSGAHPLKVQARRPLEKGSWSPAGLGEMLLGKWTKKKQDPHCLQMPENTSTEGVWSLASFQPWGLFIGRLLGSNSFLLSSKCLLKIN